MEDTSSNTNAAADHLADRGSGPIKVADAPLIKAHVRIPEAVDKRKWLKRQSSRRRSSVAASSRRDSSDRGGGGNGAASHRKSSSPRPSRPSSPSSPSSPRLSVSPPPRRRKLSMDSTASSATTEASFASTSRQSLVSTSPLRQQRQQQQQQEDGDAWRAQRPPKDANDGRGRRRSSAAVGRSRKASSAGGSRPLSSSSPSPPRPVRCSVCRDDFTPYRRPHRCRRCGEAVCATCSPARTPKRTCKRCAGDPAAPLVLGVASPQPPAVAAAPYARTAQATGFAVAAQGAGTSSSSMSKVEVRSKVVTVVAPAASVSPAAVAGAGPPTLTCSFDSAEQTGKEGEEDSSWNSTSGARNDAKVAAGAPPQEEEMDQGCERTSLEVEEALELTAGAPEPCLTDSREIRHRWAFEEEEGGHEDEDEDEEDEDEDEEDEKDEEEEGGHEDEDEEKDEKDEKDVNEEDEKDEKDEDEEDEDEDEEDEEGEEEDDENEEDEEDEEDEEEEEREGSHDREGETKREEGMEHTAEKGVSAGRGHEDGSNGNGDATGIERTTSSSRPPSPSKDPENGSHEDSVVEEPGGGDCVEGVVDDGRAEGNELMPADPPSGSVHGESSEEVRGSEAASSPSVPPEGGKKGQAADADSASGEGAGEGEKDFAHEELEGVLASAAGVPGVDYPAAEEPATSERAESLVDAAGPQDEEEEEEGEEEEEEEDREDQDHGAEQEVEEDVSASVEEGDGANGTRDATGSETISPRQILQSSRAREDRSQAGQLVDEQPVTSEQSEPRVSIDEPHDGDARKAEEGEKGQKEGGGERVLEEDVSAPVQDTDEVADTGDAAGTTGIETTINSPQVLPLEREEEDRVGAQRLVEEARGIVGAEGVVADGQEEDDERMLPEPAGESVEGEKAEDRETASLPPIPPQVGETTEGAEATSASERGAGESIGGFDREGRESALAATEGVGVEDGVDVTAATSGPKDSSGEVANTSQDEELQQDDEADVEEEEEEGAPTGNREGCDGLLAADVESMVERGMSDQEEEQVALDSPAVLSQSPEGGAASEEEKIEKEAQDEAGNKEEAAEAAGAGDNPKGSCDEVPGIAALETTKSLHSAVTAGAETEGGEAVVKEEEEEEEEEQDHEEDADREAVETQQEEQKVEAEVEEAKEREEEGEAVAEGEGKEEQQEEEEEGDAVAAEQEVQKEEAAVKEVEEDQAVAEQEDREGGEEEEDGVGEQEEEEERGGEGRAVVEKQVQWGEAAAVEGEDLKLEEEEGKGQQEDTAVKAAKGGGKRDEQREHDHAVESLIESAASPQKEKGGEKHEQENDRNLAAPPSTVAGEAEKSSAPLGSVKADGEDDDSEGWTAATVAPTPSPQTASGIGVDPHEGEVKDAPSTGGVESERAGERGEDHGVDGSSSFLDVIREFFRKGRSCCP